MVFQYRPQWTTEVGGSGFSVWHAATGTTGTQLQQWVDGIRALYIGMTATLLPVGINHSFPGEVLELSTATGELQAVRAVSPPPPTTGTGAGIYAAPAGARMRWNTAGIVAGRRVVGTTFWVPLIGSAFQDDGTLSASTVTTMSTAAAQLVTSLAGIHTIYSRPFAGDEGHPARPGSEHLVTSSSVPDKVAVLRSRRD